MSVRNTITMQELARRICVAEHDASLGGGAGFGPAHVPCALHTTFATRMYALIQPEGQRILQAIVQAAEDGGIIDRHH